MDLVIAGRPVPLERIVDPMVRPLSRGGYPWQTLHWYDHGHGVEHTPNRITAADLGRVSVFGGGLRYATARDHLRVSEREDELLPALPSELWLHKTEPGSELWNAAERTYMLYVRGGADGRANRWAQAAKLLHIKRPGFFPVTDSRFWKTYQPALDQKVDTDTSPHDWLVVRDDLVDNGAAARGEERDPDSRFAHLRDRIAEGRAQDEDDKVDNLLALTDLRLLDIAAWGLGK